MTDASQEPAPPLIRVLAINGSMRPESQTRKALSIAVEGAQKAGAEVTLLDLGAAGLPFFSGDKSLQEPSAVAFKAQVKAADALIFATPVYHDSFSGALKNALDLLYDELSEKVAAVLGVGGGRTGQGQALEHLRAVLRETNTWILPRQVVVSSADTAFDASGALVDRELNARLYRLGQELVLRTPSLRPRRAVPRSSRG